MAVGLPGEEAELFGDLVRAGKNNKEHPVLWSIRRPGSRVGRNRGGRCGAGSSGISRHMSRFIMTVIILK